MSTDVLSREALLLKIKAAEKAGQQRQEEARKKANNIRMNSQKQYSSIIEAAEKEGRQTMREHVETVKTDNSSIRDREVQVAKNSGKDLENLAEKKIPGIIDLMINLFNKEFNVKD